MSTDAEKSDRLKIGQFDRFRIRKTSAEYSVRQVGKRVITLVRVDGPPLVEEWTHRDLKLALEDGSLMRDRRYFTAADAALRTAVPVTSLGDLPAAQQKSVLHKYQYASMYLQAKATEDHKSSSADEILAIITPQIHALEKGASPKKQRKATAGSVSQLREPPSAETLLEWVRLLRAGDFNPLALADQRAFRSGNRTPRKAPEIYALIEEYAGKYCCETRPTVRQLYKEMETAVVEKNKERHERGEPPLETPSRDLLARAVRNLDQFAKVAGRYGIKRAEHQFRIIGGGLGDSVIRPLQRVEMDCWEAEIMTWLKEVGVWADLDPKVQREVKGQRFCIAVAADYASNTVVGCAADLTETTDVAKRCLRTIMSDKTPFAEAIGCASPWHMSGTPELIVTDNGSSFIAEPVRRAIIEAGCGHQITVAGIPWLRSTVEYAIKRGAREFLSGFTGRTFSNTVELGEYPAETRASHTARELLSLMLTWWIDVYHNTPQARLGGRTPRQRWDELVEIYGVEPGPDREKARCIFGMEMSRTMGPHGVRFLGISYNSAALQAYRRKVGDVPVVIRVDPDCLGRIAVCVGVDWTIVPTHRDFVGLTLDQWDATRADLRRRSRDNYISNEDTILAAVARIKAVKQSAMERFDRVTIPTADELARAERNLHIAFDMHDEAPATTSISGVTSSLLIAAGTPAVLSGHSVRVESDEPTAIEHFGSRKRRGLGGSARIEDASDD